MKHVRCFDCRDVIHDKERAETYNGFAVCKFCASERESNPDDAPCNLCERHPHGMGSWNRIHGKSLWLCTACSAQLRFQWKSPPVQLERVQEHLVDLHDAIRDNRRQYNKLLKRLQEWERHRALAERESTPSKEGWDCNERKMPVQTCLDFKTPTAEYAIINTEPRVLIL